MVWNQPIGVQEDPEARVLRHSAQHAQNPQRILDRLIGDDRPAHPPVGHVVIAEITRETADTLVTVARRLRERRRDARPVVVAIPHHPEALQRVAAVFELTITIAPHQTSFLPGVRRFLPSLYAEHGLFAFGSLASMRANRVDVSEFQADNSAAVERITHRLRVDRGVPLHRIAEVRPPSAFLYAAPEPFEDTVQSTLTDIAPVAGGFSVEVPTIAVAGLSFEEPQVAEGAYTGTSTRTFETGPMETDGTVDESGEPHPVGNEAYFPDAESRRAAAEQLLEDDSDAAGEDIGE